MEILDGPKGRMLSAHLYEGESSDHIVEAMRVNGLTQLGLGCEGSGRVDISFLTKIQGLSRLALGGYALADDSVLQSLTSLKDLMVSSPPCRNPLDLSNLQNLKELDLHWRPSVRNLDKLANLEVLTLYRFSEPDLSEIAQLSNLKELALLNALCLDLNGIENLSALTRVSLKWMPRLQTIAGLQKCEMLTYLSIQSCRKIQDLQVLSGIPNMKGLTLENLGRELSIDLVAGCSTLEKLSLIGDSGFKEETLERLLDLPRLRQLLLPKRKHYKTKVDVLKNRLAMRGRVSSDHS